MRYTGYTGTLLKVDLSRQAVTTVPLNEKSAEQYLGGVGMAAQLIHETAPAAVDPLDPGNPLIFMTGPLTGTIVPWSGRHCIASLSPLTGIWGESFAGGTWGRELKKAGFDGVILTGKADHPLYLRITDTGATLEDAAPLQGKDTFATEALLRQYLGEHIKVAAIGAAGERLVRFAAVMHDGAASRAAGRCGMGAVMGSKNLKAIAVAGTRPVPVANREKLSGAIRAAMPRLVRNQEHRAQKARQVFSMFVRDGRHAVNNWRDGFLPGFDDAVLQEIERHIRHGSPYQCAGCPTGCVESNVSRDGRRLTVWEVIAPLGSQCGVADMQYVEAANDLCNRNGIDTISAGGVISFAMECFEAGILTEKDTDGINLVFGNAAGMLAMLEKICSREGFGAVLAEGVTGAARIIGQDAERYAIEAKGLEVPAHDPRAHNFLALAYATDTRGANHTGAADPGIEGFDLMDMASVRFSVEGTAATVARGQNYATVLNSLVLCAFSHAGYAQYHSAVGFPGISARQVTEWFNLATGMEKDFSSLLQAGERIFNLKHIINLNRGGNAGADRLHERFVIRKRGFGPAADHLPPIHAMLGDYYRVRGWESDARVSDAKLQELGLPEENRRQ